MKYPLVKVTTKDHLQLFGFLAEAKDSKTILINIHGTGSGFYIEEFEREFVERLPEQGISVLFTNNRGNFVMEFWQGTGAALERFEDCLIDIDAWIELALEKGYSKIILQGHSLGTEKVVYYMERGKYRDKVIGVILLGFADSYGNQMLFLDKVGRTNQELLSEALDLVAQNKGEQFLTSTWLCHAGVLPQSAISYLSFFSGNSELSKALPLRKGRDLKYYQNIKVPILGVVGEKDHWTILPVPQAAELLRKENPLAEVYIIEGSYHSFEEHQKELVDIVEGFILKRLS